MLSLLFVRNDYEVYLTKDIMGYDTISIYVPTGEAHNTISLKFFSKEELLKFIDKINTIAKDEPYEHVTASE